MKKLNNKGYGILEFLLILIIIILLALIGWWVWKQSQPDETSKPQSGAQQAAPQEDAKDQEKKEEAKYLEIKEFGIKMKLDDATDDAYYIMDNGYAYLSLTSLKNIDDCAADETSIAAVAEVKKTDVNEQTGKTYEEEAKAGSGTLVGNNVYVVSQAQAYCSEDKAVQTKAEAARAAFPKLTIEKL